LFIQDGTPEESLTLSFLFHAAFWLIEHLGRRTLLLWGAAGIMAALFALGLVMLKTTLSLALGWLALFIITMYLGAYAASYGPISWLYMSEVFPQHLRATGMSIATAVNWATQAAVSFSFLSALNYFGPTIVFWSYGTMGIVAFIYIYLRVPETRGKTLEELAEIFQRSTPPSAIIDGALDSETPPTPERSSLGP
jgi:MFS family permease